MVPHGEGVRLHFINNQTLGLFSAIAASSNWQDKLMKYGDKEIWSRTRILFHNAYNQLRVSNLVDKDLEQLAKISQYHGKALEQEAIWL
jgi:hypothetical protein